jgi:hypothetical protein
MDFVRDAALGIRLRDLLIRVARARVPYEAVGVRLRFWRGGRLRGITALIRTFGETYAPMGVKL